MFRPAMRVLLTLMLLLSALVSAFSSAPPAAAANTIVVSSCDQYALKAAINSAASGDTITFDCSGTILVSSYLDPVTYWLTKDVTIDGTGQDITLKVVPGESGVTWAVFGIEVNTDVTLKGLTFTDGVGRGVGGVVTNKNGTLNVIDCTFTNNRAISGTGGGAIMSYKGIVNVVNSTFNSNYAWAGGGAIMIGGQLNVSGSSFNGNFAEQDGGAIRVGIESSATIRDSTFTGNPASDDDDSTNGGAIYNGGTLTVINSTFVGNEALAGGAIANVGTLDVIHSTFSGNEAQYWGNGVVSGVWAGNDYGFKPGSGPMKFTNTILANADATPRGDSEGFPLGSNCSGGTFQHGGGNFVDDTSCYPSLPAVNTATISLGPLADNGGPTLTMRLLPGSIAFDAVPCLASVPTDQRGYPRPAAGMSNCDGGAVEVGATPIVQHPTLSDVSGSGVYLGTATLTAKLAVSDDPVGGKAIDFTLNGNSVGTAETYSDGVAILKGVSLAGIDAGSYLDVIVASFAGDDNHTSSSASGTLIVDKAAAIITVDGSPGGGTYNSNPYFMTATTVPAGLNYSVTYNGSTTQPTDAGHYDVGVTIDDPNFAGSNTGELTISQAHLHIVADDKSVPVGEPIPPFTYTLTDFLGDDDASVVTGEPVLTTTATQGSPPGRYVIDVSVGTLESVNYGFYITKGTLTIDDLVPGNQSPVATNDAYQGTADSQLYVRDLGVLTNDSDPEGLPMSATVVTGPSHGTLDLDAQGSFNYYPDADYHGIDSFTYKANDGTSDSNVATVSLTISENTATTAVDDAYFTDENVTRTVAAPGVLANDIEPNADDTLSVALEVGPTHGQVTLNADGSFVYTPVTDYTGSDSFTYKVNDGKSDSNVATVTITVLDAEENIAPTAVSDSYNAYQNTTLTIPAPGLLANDTDPNISDTLIPALYSSPAHGTLTLQDDGSFTYTPIAGFNGPDYFQYMAFDGTNYSNKVSVLLVVTEAADNDAPTGLGLSGSSVAENSDVGTDIGTFTTIDSSLRETHTYSLVDGDGSTDNASFKIVGDALQTDAVLDFEAQSSYSIRVRTTDSGGLFFDQPFTISTTDLNEAPTDLALDPSSVVEDSPLNTPVGTFTTTDPETGDMHTYTLVDGVGDTGNGSFEIVGDALQTDEVFDFETKNSYSIRVRTDDGHAGTFEAIFTITIADRNESPTAINLSSNSVDENSPIDTFVGTLTTTDPDAGDTHTFSLSPGQGGEGNDFFKIVGDALQTNAVLDFEAQSSYSVRVSSDDGKFGIFEAIFTISVNNLDDNSPPTAGNDTYSTDEDTNLTIDAPGVLDNDIDVDNDPLAAVVDVGPTNGSLTLNLDGSFSYTPSENFNGSDSFTYKANDGTNNSVAATVTITVKPVNDAPTAVNDSYSTDEDTALIVTSPGPLGNDSDIEDDPLSLLIVAGPSNGVVVPVANNLFTYTPNDNFNGSDSFTYTANDGTSNSEPATVTITVNPVNDLPTVSAGGPYSINEGGSIAVSATGIDIDGTVTLTYAWDLDNNGSFETSGQDATFSAADLDGPSTFTISVQVSDGDDGRAKATAEITILNVAPAVSSFTPNNVPALTGQLVTFTLETSDVPGDPLTMTYDCGEETAARDDGCLYTSGGSYAVSVLINDGDGGQTKADLTLEVYDPETLCVTDANGAIRMVDASDCARSETLVELPQPNFAEFSICVNKWNGAARASDNCGRSEHLVTTTGQDTVAVCVNRWNGVLRVSDECSRSERGDWL